VAARATLAENAERIAEGTTKLLLIGASGGTVKSRRYQRTLPLGWVNTETLAIDPGTGRRDLEECSIPQSCPCTEHGVGPLTHHGRYRESVDLLDGKDPFRPDQSVKIVFAWIGQLAQDVPCLGDVDALMVGRPSE
jgi:hypothetical protein